MLRFWQRRAPAIGASNSNGPSAPVRILVLSDVIGATQLVNFARPLAADIAAGQATLTFVDQEQIGRDVEASAAAQWDAVMPTALILSRYSEGDEQAFVRRARSSGAPIVYHLDDNLFAVPESLGAAKYKHYNAPERLARLRAAIDASDILFASTDVLASELGNYGLRPPIMAGEIACAIEPTGLRQPKPRREPVFGYMASASHGRDLEMVLPAIEDILQRQPSLTFELFGTLHVPDPLRRFGRRVVHHAPIADYDRFLDRLAELGWWVGLAPLEDTPFNRCKTEIKWLEYTAAGVPTVASDMAVYRRRAANVEALLVQQTNDWVAAIQKLLGDGAARADLVARARRKVIADFTMQRLRAQLDRIIAAAMTVTRPR